MTALSTLAQRRAAHRRRQARRSTATALLSTAVCLAGLTAATLSAPGWPAFAQTFLDPAVAWSSAPAILRGLWLNLRILCVAAVATLLLGLLVAALRTVRGPVFLPIRVLAAGYVDVLRGTPLLIALYLVGFGVPALRLPGVPTDTAVLGTVALVVVYSAYVAEVLRAGIDSVHPAQRAAARSLGLTHRQSLRLVVLPQAVRRVLPPLLNDFVSLQKDVGLVSVLGAVDAIRAAQIESARTFTFTPYVVAGLLFVLLATISGRAADALAARVTRRSGAT